MKPACWNLTTSIVTMRLYERASEPVDRGVSNCIRFKTRSGSAQTHEIGIKLLRVKQNVSMSLTNLLAETGLPSPASPSIKYHMSSP
jgi:hypothetical protein